MPANGDCAQACEGGPNNGETCVEDSECPKACEGGLRGGACVPGAFETVCAGGQDDGKPCSVESDCRGEQCASTVDCGGGTLHVYGEAVVPEASYTIQVTTGLPSEPECFSQLVVMDTAKFGDTITSCDPCPCSPAGDGGNINDIFSSIQRFGGVPSAPSKTRANMEPSDLEHVMNITDILMQIEASFGGLAYPFLRCNDDSGNCRGGPNDGQPCTTDSECELELCSP